MAAVLAGGVAVGGCSACVVISDHKLSVSPNPVGEPITFSATWDYPPHDDDVRRLWDALPGEFDLDGDGVFETKADVATFKYDAVSKTFSSPATINVSHAVRAKDKESFLPSVQTSVATRTVEVRSDTQVNQPPLASIVSSPNPAPPNSQVTLDASGSMDPDGSIVRYSWDLNGDGRFDRQFEGDGPSLGPTNSFYVGGEGTYAVHLAVTDDDGAVSVTTGTVIVRDSPPVNQPPVASLTANPNPAPSEAPVTLDGSSSADPDGTIAKYEFDLDGNGTFELDNGADPTATKTFVALGSYSVGLRVTDNSGNTATDSETITVVAHRSRGGEVAQEPSNRPRKPVSIELRGGAREVRAGRFLLNGDQLLNLGNIMKGKIASDSFPKRLRRGERKLGWASRSDIRTDVETQRSVVRGVGLLEFPAGGIACLAYKLVVSDDGAGKGRFRVIGARGKARRLRANGIGTATAGRDSLTLRGYGTARFTKPWRTLGGFGCGSLRRL